MTATYSSFDPKLGAEPGSLGFVVAFHGFEKFRDLPLAGGVLDRLVRVLPPSAGFFASAQIIGIEVQYTLQQGRVGVRTIHRTGSLIFGVENRLGKKKHADQSSILARRL
jgi:hypothetical protein